MVTDTVIVTNAEKRSALAVIRSLGKQGIRVIACSHTKYSPSFYSKYCHSHFIYPAPTENIKAFVSKLNDFCSRIKNPIVFPVSDDINLILTQNKINAKILMSSPMDYATNKKKLFDFAKKINIQIPKTTVIKNKKDMNKINQFPCIVKPIQSQYILNNQIKSSKVHIARTKEDLIAHGTPLLKQFDEFLLQEYVPGKGVGYFAIAKKGRVLLDFQHERLREVPYTGGPSSLRKSIYDSKLEQLSSKLLTKLKWTGLAMVEFRKEGDNYYLMEINGRAWGSLALAQHSEVDFPYNTYKLFTNQVITPVRYLLGVKSRWLIPGDIYHINSVLQSKLSLKEKRLRVKRFLKFNGEKFDYIQQDDLLPAIMFSLFLTILGWRKILS